MSAGPRPYVEIQEQPVSRGFRFRYECEGRSAGSIMGENSTRDNRCFPKIKVQNSNGGPSIVVVSCVTKDDPPRPHPHNLVGKDCQKGVCTVRLNNTDVTTFPNIGIQCCKRKDVPKALQERRDIRVDPFATGFNYDINTLDLTVVRLCFQVFLKDDNGKFTKVGKPAVSHCIYDKKSKLDLGICRISRQAGCVSGGEEIILLCEKVSKDDIEIAFTETDSDGAIQWEARGDFGPQDVHRQYAIVFRTPAYRDRSIRSPVNIQVFLKRPSDAETSEPLEFQYTPENRDPEGVEAKRSRKRLYQDVESNAFGMHQAGGAMSMQAFMGGAMKAEPVSGRDALRDKLMHGGMQGGRGPGQNAVSMASAPGAYSAAYNMPPPQQPPQQSHMTGGLQGFNYMSIGGQQMQGQHQQGQQMQGQSMQQGIPQASPLGNLPGHMTAAHSTGMENTLNFNALNTDDLLSVAAAACDPALVNIKVEEPAFNSGQIDSDQLRQIMDDNTLEFDQLLTDLSEMQEMTSHQDPHLAMGAPPNRNSHPI